MGSAQLAQAARPERGEPQPNDAVVRGVDVPGDEAGFGRTVDEPDRAVVAEHQGGGDVSDRGGGAGRVAADGEQELMLGGGDPARGGLLLAPVEELAESGAQLQQPPVVRVVGAAGPSAVIGRHDEIS